MTPTPTIRVIQDSDWPAINRIQRESFPPGAIESCEVLRTISQHSPGSCLIAEGPATVSHPGGPLGYVLAHPWIPADLPPIKACLPPIPATASCLFFHDLAITPVARGTGLAHRLVEEVLAWARQRGLVEGSLVSVQGSQRFWARYGFEEDPVLTERFREMVGQLYGLDFAFMTGRLMD